MWTGCRRPVRSGAGQDGQSTVELAVALPVVLLVLLAVVQLALVVHAHNVVTTAAQEGARYGAAEGRTAVEGGTRAREVLASGIGREAAAFTVSAHDTGETVEVRVQGRYPVLIAWVSGRAIDLTATAQMRREGFRAGP